MPLHIIADPNATLYMMLLYLVDFLSVVDKGGSVEERLYKKLHSTANLKSLFLSLF